MQKAIELLTKHFNKFVEELKQETNQCIEKMANLFSGEEGEKLQNEINKLLKKLDDQIEHNNNMQNKFKSAKDKLKSRSKFPCKKQKREELLKALFNGSSITKEELVKNLESIKLELSKKLNPEDINVLTSQRL
ncbi:hypothetical protein C2G38_2137723 [Gigaspora rosea]|uniref:Uncharacterized protein n=1 Tax=Gigaspora rosea TaxID=44941 RepID=A0A397W085_9GLOM|nr:hypothetical protein C2G38_2137723 [Gigaspora rosea]